MLSCGQKPDMLKLITLLTLLFLGLPSLSGASTDDEQEDCELRLVTGIFDIRNYDKRVTPAPRTSYNLTVETLDGTYAMTVRPMGHGKGTLLQIVNEMGTDRTVEIALQRMANQWAGLPPTSPSQLRYLLPETSELQLKEELQAFTNKLKAGFQKDTLTPTSFSRTDSTRVEALATMLTGFLRRNGIDEEDRFFAARLEAIHRQLMTTLTTKERAFFDYAIFSDFLGYEAETKAEEAERLWRGIEPDAGVTYAQVHQQIRSRFLTIALNSQADFRSQKTYQLRVFEKIDAALARWLEKNPTNTLNRLRALAKSEVVQDSDVNWLLSLGHTGEPLISFFENAEIRAILDKYPNERGYAMARMRLNRYLKRWHLDRTDKILDAAIRIAEQGMQTDDIDTLLTTIVPAGLVKSLKAWDITELKSQRDGKPDLRNSNPIGMEVDHRVKSSPVKIKLSQVSQYKGSGGVMGVAETESLGILPSPQDLRRQYRRTPDSDK